MVELNVHSIKKLISFFDAMNKDLFYIRVDNKGGVKYYCIRRETNVSMVGSSSPLYVCYTLVFDCGELVKSQCSDLSVILKESGGVLGQIKNVGEDYVVAAIAGALPCKEHSIKKQAINLLRKGVAFERMPVDLLMKLLNYVDQCPPGVSSCNKHGSCESCWENALIDSTSTGVKRRKAAIKKDRRKYLSECID